MNQDGCDFFQLQMRHVLLPCLFINFETFFFTKILSVYAHLLASLVCLNRAGRFENIWLSIVKNLARKKNI